MKKNQLILLGLGLLPFCVWAKQSMYCPQRSGYISVGMTVQEVLQACGQPISKHASNRPVTSKVPVKQLIYTSLNKGSPDASFAPLNPIYAQWSLPSGSQGVTLQVDIINNKVASIQMNGSSTNAMSICGGASIQTGDSESQVINACGGPDLVNQTFVNQFVPSNEKPEVWTYHVDQYQAPFSLTFANGKLQSID